MVNAIQNVDVSPAIVRSMMYVTTKYLTWRPCPTFCPKGCVQMIDIVPCVQNTCCCLQNRQSHLTLCKPSRLSRVRFFFCRQAGDHKGMGTGLINRAPALDYAPAKKEPHPTFQSRFI